MRAEELEESHMGSVSVEMMSWLRRYFAAESQGRVIVDIDVSDGATVREVLEEVASQNQELKDVLFDDRTERLSGYVWGILNGRPLDLAGGLEARLKPGDTIRLLPDISGG